MQSRFPITLTTMSDWPRLLPSWDIWVGNTDSPL